MPDQQSGKRCSDELLFTGPLGCGYILPSTVDLANNPTFGLLGGSGGGDFGTTWWDLGQWSSQVNEINNNHYIHNHYINNYYDNKYYNNSYGSDIQSLAFEQAPESLHYQTDQAHVGLSWQYPDSEPSPEKIAALSESTGGVFTGHSTLASTPMTQSLPLVPLETTLSRGADMPMQSWDFQYIHYCSPFGNEEAPAAASNFGQQDPVLMSSFGEHAIGSMSMAYTPDMAWQTGAESSSFTSPISLVGDQFLCEEPNCKFTSTSQKALR